MTRFSKVDDEPMVISLSLNLAHCSFDIVHSFLSKKKTASFRKRLSLLNTCPASTLKTQSAHENPYAAFTCIRVRDSAKKIAVSVMSESTTTAIPSPPFGLPPSFVVNVNG